MKPLFTKFFLLGFLSITIQSCCGIKYYSKNSISDLDLLLMKKESKKQEKENLETQQSQTLEVTKEISRLEEEILDIEDDVCDKLKEKKYFYLYDYKENFSIDYKKEDSMDLTYICDNFKGKVEMLDDDEFIPPGGCNSGQCDMLFNIKLDPSEIRFANISNDILNIKFFDSNNIPLKVSFEKKFAKHDVKFYRIENIKKGELYTIEYTQDNIVHRLEGVIFN